MRNGTIGSRSVKPGRASYSSENGVRRPQIRVAT